jgi:hypothetical protein
VEGVCCGERGEIAEEGEATGCVEGCEAFEKAAAEEVASS